MVKHTVRIVKMAISGDWLPQEQCVLLAVMSSGRKPKCCSKIWILQLFGLCLSKRFHSGFPQDKCEGSRSVGLCFFSETTPASHTMVV